MSEAPSTSKYLYRLRVSNFLGVEAARVIQFGKVTRIAGPNTSGKTSLLKAIEAGLIARGENPNLVNIYATSEEGKPEPKAEVVLDLGDLRVTRSFTRAGGNYPKLKRYDAGTEMWLDEDKKVATLLKSLVDSPLIFNPAEFVLSDEERRRALILQALPIRITPDELKRDFGETHLGPVNCDRHGLEVIAEVLATINEKRTGVGREVDKLKGAWESIVLPEDFVDAGPRDTKALMASVEAAGQAKSEQAHLERQALEEQHRAQTLGTQITELETRLEELRGQKTQAEAQATKLLEQAQAVQIPDVSAAEESLSATNEYEQNRRKAAEKQAAEKAYAKGQSVYEELDRLSKLAQSMPALLLNAAEMPIEGLSVEIGDLVRGKPELTIRYQGRLLEDLSTAEQLLLGLAVAKATAGDLKIILVDRLECLDAASYAALMEQMAADDYQYVISEVGDWWGCEKCAWEGAEPCFPEDGEGNCTPDPVCPQCGGPVSMRKHLDIVAEGELPASPVPSVENGAGAQLPLT
jgi:DNA repair exonuclease SbcCD ATPase subunit